MLITKCIGTASSDPKEIGAQYKSGERFGEFRIGAQHLIHRYFFVTRYILLQEIRRVYLRIESGESGDFSTDICCLVLENEAGTEFQLHADRRDTIDRLMVRLRELLPELEIGKKR